MNIFDSGNEVPLKKRYLRELGKKIISKCNHYDTSNPVNHMCPKVRSIYYLQGLNDKHIYQLSIKDIENFGNDLNYFRRNPKDTPIRGSKILKNLINYINTKVGIDNITAVVSYTRGKTIIKLLIHYNDFTNIVDITFVRELSDKYRIRCGAISLFSLGHIQNEWTDKFQLYSRRLGPINTINNISMGFKLAMTEYDWSIHEL